MDSLPLREHFYIYANLWYHFLTGPKYSLSFMEHPDTLATIRWGHSMDEYNLPKKYPNQPGILTGCLTHHGRFSYILDGKCHWVQIDSPGSTGSRSWPKSKSPSSDALSLAHSLSGDIFYGGFRNGSVEVYDFRAGSKGRLGFKESSSVCDIVPLYVTPNAMDPFHCDSPYLYTSIMNGEVFIVWRDSISECLTSLEQINQWDLRNLKDRVRGLPGHVNQHQRLNLTLVENSMIVSRRSLFFSEYYQIAHAIWFNMDSRLWSHDPGLVPRLWGSPMAKSDSRNRVDANDGPIRRG
jgi:hypothetical protein